MDPTNLTPPTQDERLLALLAHILQIVSWFIGPLVIFLVKRDSLFVRFHALQALLWQAVLVVGWGIGMVGFMVAIFVTIATQPQNPHPNASPTAFFLGAFGFWLLMMGAMVLNLVLGIVYGIKANNGEWARYPLLGRLAWRFCSNKG